jgi:hypothetical protein
MSVNLMHSNLYFAQVDEAIVVPGAKIAGFHSLHYDSVMSSFVLIKLLPNTALCCSYIKCVLPPVELAVMCRSFFYFFLSLSAFSNII